jgi:hypothetical protein
MLFHPTPTLKADLHPVRGAEVRKDGGAVIFSHASGR